MALPTGLIPVYGFVLTVGVAVPVTLGAILYHRIENGSFGSALRAGFLEASGLYVVGVIVIWFIAGGGAIWGVATALLVTGLIALVILMILPLVVGQQLIQRIRDVDSETALQFATYGWPIAMLIVFGIFVAPEGVAHGHLFDLGGNRVCLAGFCGIAVSFAAAVALELVVAVLGPGIIGLVMNFSADKARGQLASS